MQGVIRHTVLYDKEEGEIIHNLSKEQIAEMFQLNPDELPDDLDDPAAEVSSPVSDEAEDVDEVEVEDVTDEYYPTYDASQPEDLPDFQELFKIAEEDLQRKAEERATQEQSEKPDEQELKRKADECAAFMAERRKQWFEKSQRVPLPPKYTKYYKIKGTRSEGHIIAWAYIQDLRVFAIKRERGIDYFQRPDDLKSLPFYEVRQLARIKMLYSESEYSASWLEHRLQQECQYGWKLLRPQFPTYYVHKTKVNKVGKPLHIGKYKPARIMRKVPLRKMPQNFSSRFQWWYYEGVTTEAIIVLKDDKDEWDVIRVFDPMWLRNLSKEDMKTLFNNYIHMEIQDWDQAFRFQKVVNICYAFDIHS